MRTIKFRGKGIDTVEWVFGNYSYNGKYHFIDRYVIDNSEVEPSSVGQFTGLIDKNGKEIYEGDIITVNGKYPKLVRFIDEWASFCLANVVDLDEDMDTGYWHQVSPGWWTSSKREIQIIGNVFDNPELLKGGSHE